MALESVDYAPLDLLGVLSRKSSYAPIAVTVLRWLIWYSKNESISGPGHRIGKESDRREESRGEERQERRSVCILRRAKMEIAMLA